MIHELDRVQKEDVWHNLRCYPGIYLEDLRKNHEKLQSGWPVSGPVFAPGTFRIGSRNANHSTATSVRNTAKCCRT
jgi:hypothetical protein